VKNNPFSSVWLASNTAKKIATFFQKKCLHKHFLLSITYHTWFTCSEHIFWITVLKVGEWVGWTPKQLILPLFFIIFVANKDNECFYFFTIYTFSTEHSPYCWVAFTTQLLSYLCFLLFSFIQLLHHQWYQSGLLVAFQYSLNGFLFQHFEQTFQPFNQIKQVLQTSFFFLNWSLVFHCQQTPHNSKPNAFSNGVDFIHKSCLVQAFSLFLNNCCGFTSFFVWTQSTHILLSFSTAFFKSFSSAISSLFFSIVEVNFLCKLLIVFCASTSSCPSALYFSAHTSHLPLSVSIVSFCASNFFSSTL